MAVQLTPDDNLLNIASDPIFKAVLTKDTEESRAALRDILSTYIGSPIDSVEVKQNEPAVDYSDEKQIRFDISCKFSDGRLADVEMTRFPSEFETERLEWYIYKLFISQNIKSEIYGSLKDVYQISFLDTGPKTSMWGGPKDHFMVHNFMQYDHEHNVDFGGKVHIITVELGKLPEKSIDQLDDREEWGYFIKHGSEKDKIPEINKLIQKKEGIKMAAETLITISKDENERARLLLAEKNHLDWLDGIRAGERRGERKGINIGEARAAAKFQPQIEAQQARIAELEQRLKAAGLQ
jgi:predicted transposase/invertase (TIGR01784 family)